MVKRKLIDLDESVVNKLKDAGKANKMLLKPYIEDVLTKHANGEIIEPCASNAFPDDSKKSLKNQKNG